MMNFECGILNVDFIVLNVIIQNSTLKIQH